MKQSRRSIRRLIKDKLTHVKNNNTWLLLLWNERLRARGRKELAQYSDLQAVNRSYYTHAGRYPNLENPTLFSEKLQWLKLHCQNPLMAQCADKFEVRSHIEAKGYGDLLNELIASYEKVEDFDLDTLPTRFVLKGAHGSAWNIVCRDKDKINWTPWRLIMKSWLKHNIFWNGREFVYRDLKPRIVCEKYLEDASGELMDYKFFCFNGEPKFVQVNMGRGAKRPVQNFYDLQWNLQPFGKDLMPNPDADIPKPENLERMVEIARDLATPFTFVRSDFYNVNGKIYFGELTFFPASGMPDFVPTEYDAILGDMLTLPSSSN